VITYDGKRFRPIADGTGAEQRVAVYRQAGELLWGEFSGGRARHGALAGTSTSDGTLHFAYCMVLDGGEVISGHCVSTPLVLADGRIQLREMWERYGPHADTGVSYLEEIPSPAIGHPTSEQR
jgi:hypothetical protein